MSVICQSRKTGWKSACRQGKGKIRLHRVSLHRNQKKENKSALKHNNHPAHFFSSWAVSHLQFSQLPFSLQSYAYCLYLKSLSVSISLICHFIMMKYVQALFPSPFGTVFQRKTRLAHCSPVLTVKLSLVIKLSTLLLPNKLSKSLCDC